MVIVFLSSGGPLNLSNSEGRQDEQNAEETAWSVP